MLLRPVDITERWAGCKRALYLCRFRGRQHGAWAPNPGYQSRI